MKKSRKPIEFDSTFNNTALNMLSINHFCFLLLTFRLTLDAAMLTFGQVHNYVTDINEHLPYFGLKHKK